MRRLAEKRGRGSRTAAHYEARGDRNAAVALLSMAVLEVRSAGRYLFRHQPRMLDRLADPALRRRRSKAKKNPEPQPD